MLVFEYQIGLSSYYDILPLLRMNRLLSVPRLLNRCEWGYFIYAVSVSNHLRNNFFLSGLFFDFITTNFKPSRNKDE